MLTRATRHIFRVMFRPVGLVALVLADSGDLTRFAESQIASVRPTDPAFITRLGTALDAVSTHLD